MFAPGADGVNLKFGQTVDDPQQKAGVVAVNQVNDLVSECGCTDDSGRPLKPGALPFQGFAKIKRDAWRLRVEPPAFHELDGESVFGCAWIFALAGSEQNPNR